LVQAVMVVARLEAQVKVLDPQPVAVVVVLRFVM
jgi:hypothetical protein